MDNQNQYGKYLLIIFGLILVVLIVWFATAGEEPASTMELASEEELPADYAEDMDADDEYWDEDFDDVEPAPESEFMEALEATRDGALSEEISFAHVVPGEYSEVYLRIKGEPGKEVTRRLIGPGMISPEPQTIVIGEDGFGRFVWRINRYGTYEAKSERFVDEEDGGNPFGGRWEWITDLTIEVN